MKGKYTQMARQTDRQRMTKKKKYANVKTDTKTRSQTTYACRYLCAAGNIKKK